MEDSKLTKWKEQLADFWGRFTRRSEEDSMPDVGREKIVVFVVSFILALCLWLMVNLSRDYNLNLNLPITVGNVPVDRALTEELPDFATVSIRGEGWKLINLYNNPPRIFVDITQQEINLYDQVRQQMDVDPNISVQKVQPLILNVDLEARASKTVPVRSRVNVEFREQYGFVGDPVLQPDSITVEGASTLLRNITYWETDSVNITGVNSSVSESIFLKDPGSLLTLSRDEVTFTGEVSQFTEGEVRVEVQTRGQPRGRTVSYSPSSITVRYNVPIGEYARVRGSMPFTAYVNYEQIERDSTGFVAPRIEQTAENVHLSVRSFQPREISYFIVLGN